MLEVVFKYERKMIFSSGVMASAENNRPRLPFMFFFIPLIFTEFVTILSQIDLVAKIFVIDYIFLYSIE